MQVLVIDMKFFLQRLQVSVHQWAAHHRRYGACPEPDKSLILDHSADHLPDGLVGVVLGLQAGFDQVEGVGDSGREAAADAAGHQVAQQGDVVLISAQRPLDGAVRAQPGTCWACRALQLWCIDVFGESEQRRSECR